MLQRNRHMQDCSFASWHVQTTTMLSLWKKVPDSLREPEKCLGRQSGLQVWVGVCVFTRSSQIVFYIVHFTSRITC